MWIKENSKTFYIHSRHRVGRKVRGFLYSWRIIAWFEHDNIVRICWSEIGPLDTGRSDHVVHERSYKQFNKVIVYGQSQVGWEMKLWSERCQEMDLSPCLPFWLFCKIHDIFSCSPICWPFLSDFFLLFFSHSVVSDSLRPHGLQHARFPCPSLSPRFVQTHVHWVSDTIQPSHPLSPPSPALNLPLSVYNSKVLDHHW